MANRLLQTALVAAIVLSVSLADADVTRFIANRLIAPGSAPNMIGTSAYDTDTRISSVDPTLFLASAGNSFNAVQACSYGADTGDIEIDLFKTRSASKTCDANSLVSSGDAAARFRFYAADGTVFRELARISALVDGSPGSADMPGSLIFYTTLDGGTTLAQALKLGNDKAATFAGTITSTATADVGWSVQSAANQACNTTCTSACVFGQNAGASNVIVGCADATADVCVCAGAS